MTTTSPLTDTKSIQSFQIFRNVARWLFYVYLTIIAHYGTGCIIQYAHCDHLVLNK